MIKDSGTRRKFESGAVRDIQEGKGRCDLLPLREISHLMDVWNYNNINNIKKGILDGIGLFIETGNQRWIEAAVLAFADLHKWTFPQMCLAVAKHYEEGCNKYGERNWEKGIPLHCFIDSGVRHFLKWCDGQTDERHDRAFVWNMLGALWTLNHKPELNDLPFAQKKAEEGAELSRTAKGETENDG